MTDAASRRAGESRGGEFHLILSMRKRDPDLGTALQGGQFVPPLALEFATAGGPQKLQCWNTAGIFRLIQSIPSPKAKLFKRWLARAVW